MLRVALKGVLAHRRRLVSTSLAVLLGVSFLCGTLVLGDTVQRSFNDLLQTVNAGTDSYVRSATAISTGGEGPGSSPDSKERAHIDQALVDQVRAVPGVAAAEGRVQARATVLDKRGDELGSGGRGAPSFGGSWTTDAELNPFHLVAGAAPANPDDVVLDKGTADTAGFHVGDTVTVVVTDGAHQVHLSGIARFGQSDSPGGANYALFTLPTAEQLLSSPGRIDSISARADAGISQDELSSRIRAALPDSVEVLTGAQITAEQQDAFQQRIAGFTTFFSAFGYIAVLVGAFVIYNTFSIIVAQRTREMALLRAIGAGRGQVLGSVMVEAAAIGIVASSVGVISGIGVGAGLRGLFGAVGFGFPPGGLVLSSSTIVIGFVVGTAVTLFAAMAPAVRASRVKPLAALREAAVDTSSSSRSRTVAGIVISALGVLLIARGVSGKVVGPIGIGSFVTLIGMVVIGPVVARPASFVLGGLAPRVRGVTGALARENAMRNPRRTSGTAAALMVGVAVVTLFAVMGASLKATASDQIDKSFVGDFIVGRTFGRGTGFSPELAPKLAAVPGVAVAAPIRVSEVEIGSTGSAVLATEPTALAEVLHLDVEEGSLEHLGTTGVAISRTKADNAHLHLGDPLTLTYTETGAHAVTVQAIFASNDLLDAGYMVSTELDDAAQATPKDNQVLIKLGPGADATAVRAELRSALTDYPTARVNDIIDIKRQLTSRVNTLLAILFGMLALSILIASIGISNTLQLSVHERTHELGMLRAVGTTRDQLRSMVRWESAIIALFGTLGGLVLGTALGWAIVHGLGGERNLIYKVPTGQAALIVVAGGFIGILAAVRPAARAAKLDVLRAIATE